MKNIFLIPTDKESRLWRDLDSNKLTFDNLSHSNSNECTKCSHEYVYITSDEKLKDGEYGLSKLNEVIKFHSGYDSRYYMKIVLTNDLKLIEDGVQEIVDNFFEWLVLNPICEEVETERFYSMSQSSYSGIEYEIIIPKEERKKNFYCGDEVDYGEQCGFQCENCVDATGVDYGYLPNEKEEQKQHLIDIMKSDEELGLYSESGVKEIKLEDVFNDKKREKVKRVIHQHKVLKGLSLVNPAHLQMTSNGHGEFPDGYKLTEKGIQYIIEQLNKEQDGK